MSTPEGLPSISGHRYEGHRLEQKYGWMQHGRGPEAVTAGADLLRALAKDYADCEQTIRTELGQLGVSWEGTAAEAVAAALSRVADWAQGGAATSAAGGSAISAYGDSFAQLKSKIPAPVEAGETSGWGDAADSLGGALAGDLSAVTGLQSDYRGRLAEYKRLDRAANDALYAHEANSRHALESFPIPGEPRVVTAPAAATGTLSSDAVRAHDPHPGDQSPTTAPAAGGVARAGGAVPDSGLPGGGVGGPVGVDPGGALSGRCDYGDYCGYGVSGHGVSGHGVSGHGVSGHGVSGQDGRRQHPNSVVSPSDEPFAVRYDDVPAVLRPSE
jgi:hypothetical protein